MADYQQLPEHIQKPHLRPVQPVQVQNKQGQKYVALRDPTMLSQQTVVLPPQALQLLQFFQGQHSLHDIHHHTQVDQDKLIELAQALDQVGLLWGPTFEQFESQMKQKIEEHGAFPASASTSMGPDESACREKMDAYFNQSEPADLDGEVCGIVGPQLDYERGWPNYAAAYHCLREMNPPDRVVIFGTNHFGLGDGVVMAEYGFETPMGRFEPDREIFDRLHNRFGRPLIIDQLDLMPEHSIELHLPWIAYCFGNVPIVAALIPDPLTPMIEDNDERVATEPFIEALREALDDVGGQTIYIASSDLSHVGPQFGEPRAVDDQRRIEVEQHDREMLGKFLAGDVDEFLSAMQWNKNPTRWCSIGNMSAMLRLARPGGVELIDYRQAVDEQGFCLVSSLAAAMYA